MSNSTLYCTPLTKIGADYVRELIAPSGASSCDGPPDGSDNGAATAKTRDQVVISQPTWFPDSAWDFVTFVTPYYAQQVVIAAFPTGNDATVVRQWVRYTLNSIPAQAWWEAQLPAWHNPADYSIYNDDGVSVVVPIPLAVGFICPRILRSLFSGLQKDAPITTMVREVRRWGRYVTVAPVANATQLKGRMIASSLQFNSALNPHKLPDASTDDLVPDPDNPNFSIFSPTMTRVSSTTVQYNDGLGNITQFPQTVGGPGTSLTVIYPWQILTSTGQLVVSANTPIRVFLVANGANSSMQWFNDLTNQLIPNAVISGTEPLSFDFRIQFANTLNELVVDNQWLARYSTTPDFSFPALQQADDKSYTNGFIEGCTSRVAYGKDHLDYVATREWRPLVRAPPTGIVQQPMVGTKFDLVDPSGKWQIIYSTSIDPAASFSLILGTHYQFCSETDQLFQLFKRPPAEYDVTALDLARELQAKLPHSYPAAFNDGGILPSLLNGFVKAGIAHIPSVVGGLAGALTRSLRSIGTADRVVGYPNQYVAVGGNSVSEYKIPNGNGNGKRNGRRNRQQRAKLA